MSDFERWYPLVLAAIVAVASFFCGGMAVAAFPGLEDALKRMYSALMNVSAIYTGFLANLWFTLHFGTTVRLEKVRETQTFADYMNVVRVAFYSGLLAATISVPMVAFELLPSTPRAIGTYAFAVWAFVIAWSIAALARVGHLYLHFSDRQPK